MRIAIIGVGNMGGAVARRLVTGDFDVVVYDPSAEAVARSTAVGADAADSLESAVKGADAVLTSLPTPELVVDSVQRALRVVDGDTIVVDISTIDPQTARRVADDCADAGTPFVACPLGKTPTHAEQGAIPVFVGGDPQAITALRPVLERMSERVYDFGTVEAATTFKLVSNLVGMANVTVLAEGLAIAKSAGIAPEQFTEALADTGAHSFQSQVRLPWMLERDWAPRFGVDLAAKDVRLALGAAAHWKLPTPVGGAALAQLLSASQHGWGGEDVVAVAKLVEHEEGDRG